MAVAGWVVVVPWYRKDRWPHHFDDVRAAFEWTMNKFPEPLKLVVGGYSAGGHLATLLVENILNKGSQEVHGCVFGFPAVDPKDESATYVRLPVGGCCGYRAWQSCLNWFFKTK